MKRTHAIKCMAALSLCAGIAQASTYTGTLGAIAVSPSNSGNGLTRVSIILSSAVTSCSNPFAFAFEYSGTTEYGKAWMAMLIAAKTSGADIVINGTGSCDSFGVENVVSVHMP